METNQLSAAIPQPTNSHVPALHQQLLAELSWQHIHTMHFPVRDGRWVAPATLPLTDPGLRVASQSPLGIYKHQQLALAHLLAGRNTAVTTGTGSGKSLVFQTAAIDLIAKDDSSRILVLYPLRALAEEQHERWNKALRIAGLQTEALLIIGDGIGRAERAKAIAKARIVIATPDILHAWAMLNREKEAGVRRFLKHLRLVAIDEAHAYTAVFGTQSAFLFRRLDHAVRRLGGCFQIAAASATMAEAGSHLRALTGRDFTLVGPESDSSPQHLKRLHFIQPAGASDLIAGLGRWFRACADTGDSRFLAFVESRVQAEHFARGAGRQSIDDESSEVNETGLEAAAGGAVRAYRSGFDNSYRRELVDHLRSGRVSGLISTSALELGMDLPDLGLGFIVGAPRSATAFFQRLGRFGRHGPADIFIVADGSAASAELMRNPELVRTLPLQRSTLYLDNPRVQYIHVLCQAHEERWSELDNPPSEFSSQVDFPAGFLELCGKELRGESVGDLRAMRPAGDEAPHHVFPLRDCDLQFTVKCGRGHFVMKLGTMTFAQVLREAYPGAVYWHAGRAYRVRSVQVNRRMVLVDESRQCFTKPRALSPVIQPDLAPEAVLVWRQHGDLSVVETGLQARESVSGFHERRGSAERDVQYPLQENEPSGVVYANERFCRHIESTGVLLSHPELSNAAVRISEIASALEDSFLRVVPIERQDLAAGTGRLRVSRRGLQRGDRFVALYDRVYGSLRLSSHLSSPDVLKDVLSRAVTAAQNSASMDAITLQALRALAHSAQELGRQVAELDTPTDTTNPASVNLVQVIRPGTCGVHRSSGATFQVEGAFYSPGGIRYRGRFDHQRPDDLSGHIPASEIRELPGETEFAQFDITAGAILS
ncbi:DEAD/DEAH box helicase [Horticoccus luteus]|uniref:DEAD/DEAH box helicase n=1 Tax=Horticoccus luteus TaxID=2862869 RepID=A0A8F9TTL0_9BACT|nr:DEAD/DEAH box helicase [Horticoccus luteus]QYM77811.1 DEAD/DEAH box helicase [Horticoccus luteus]